MQSIFTDLNSAQIRDNASAQAVKCLQPVCPNHPIMYLILVPRAEMPCSRDDIMAAKFSFSSTIIGGMGKVSKES